MAVLLVLLSLGIISAADIRWPVRVQEIERRIELRLYDWTADFTGGMEGAAFSPEAPPLVIQGKKTAADWEFEGASPPGEVDLLCIHSHPDDESIDFGGLLARASMEGKTTAVVLCTDGESGLSRGPSRPGVSGGAEPLKETRIAEARAAMAWLGVDYYVRLGFENHPYSSQLQVLPIEDVYADWGGYGKRRRVSLRRKRCGNCAKRVDIDRKAS
ncbi:MAG: PIG-L family deacetylase [Spirochaetota bacterium]|nr:PIG-L family deacetylase [Spirochaetota bacterium]